MEYRAFCFPSLKISFENYILKETFQYDYRRNTQ